MAAHHCRVSQAAATAACNTIADLADSGGNGTLVIYTGAEPTHANDAAATEVATCAAAGAFWGAASYTAGTHTSDAALTATVSDPHATGNASAATHFRVINGSAAVVLQGTCSGTAGDDLVLNSAVIATGSQVDITALTLSVPIDQA